MSPRFVCTVVALLLLAALACGEHRSGRDDRSGDAGPADAGADAHADSGDADRGERSEAGRRGRAGAAGGAGRPAADGGEGGRAGGGGVAGDAASARSVECGPTTCESPAGAFASACCVDEASGICGVSVLGRCVQPPEDAFGCPGLDFAGVLMLPSCCTPRGMCGIDVSSVGGPSCLDLAAAAERARTAGATVVFPAPRSCEAIDADAGVEDDAGQ